MKKILEDLSLNKRGKIYSFSNNELFFIQFFHHIIILMAIHI